MVEADSGDQTAIKLPDGAETFIAKAEKNDLNQFEMTIGEKEMISHDTMRLRFDFDKDLYLGLTPGQHLRIFAPPKEDGGQLVSRMYTPVSPIDEKGQVTFVIKVYGKCDEFPEGGYMSQYLCSREVGDKLNMEGPMGKIKFFGNGSFAKMGKPFTATKLGMIAGGSGITPIFHVMDAMRRAKDTTCDVKFLYTNKTEGDILIKEELDRIAKECPNISVNYTLTREKSADESILNGRISMDMLN
jgi:NAD(P)H-flavin reductase